MLPQSMLGTWFDKGVAPSPFDLLQDSSGVTAVEYGLIATLIAVAAVLVMSTIGGGLTRTFQTIANNL